MLSLTEAYEQALRAAVRVDRPRGLRLVRLTGPQRVWFLQNTVTADVEGVPAGRWVESCFLDPKGRVQAHFRVGFGDEDVWLDVSPPAAEALAEWFTRYRFRTKVEIETVERPCFTVLGTRAAGLAPPGAFVSMPDGCTFGYSLGDVEAADVHTMAPPSDLRALPQAPPELHEILRVEAGMGAFGVDFGTRDLPQEAGLTRVVSVTKGCYVGQETVARIHFRGHVNRVLRTLYFDHGDPAALVGRGLLYEGAPAGRVTSAVLSPRLGTVGLGMVRVEPPEGARLEVEDGPAAIVGPVPEGTKVKAVRETRP